MATKQEEKFFFFWGHTEKSGRAAVFSNWYPSKFVEEENGQKIEYQNVEQYMMKKKADLFNDTETAKQIMETSNPGKIKSLGRQVANFNDDLWTEKCRDIVYHALLLKFSQNEDLKNIMLKEQDATYVEASPNDARWGIGLSANDPRAKSRNTWLGTNWLGEELTRVRDHLKEQQKSKS